MTIVNYDGRRGKLIRLSAFLGIVLIAVSSLVLDSAVAENLVGIGLLLIVFSHLINLPPDKD